MKKRNIVWEKEKTDRRLQQLRDKLHQESRTLNYIPLEKPILQLTLEGEFVKEWDSAKDATTFLGKSEGALSACLKGKTKSAYGFKWVYKN